MTKGKSWGNLTKPCSEGYNQHSSGESHSGGPTGKNFESRSKEYDQKSSGESHKSVGSGKFIGGTKGNTDLPPNRTAGAPAQGGYKGK